MLINLDWINHKTSFSVSEEQHYAKQTNMAIKNNTMGITGGTLSVAQRKNEWTIKVWTV